MPFWFGPPPQKRMKDKRRRPICTQESAINLKGIFEAYTKSTYHHENFQGGKPKLGFAIELDWQEVEANNDHNEDGDPNGNVDRTVPVANDNSSSGNFIRNQDAEGIPVEPSGRSSQQSSKR
jgi:hypothetical protein